MTANTIIIIHRTDTIQLSLFIGNLPSWLQPSGPGGLFSPGQHPTTLLHVMRTEFYKIPTLIVCGYSAPLSLFIIFLCFWYTYMCALLAVVGVSCMNLWFRNVLIYNTFKVREDLYPGQARLCQISRSLIYIWAYMPSKSSKDPLNLAVDPMGP